MCKLGSIHNSTTKLRYVGAARGALLEAGFGEVKAKPVKDCTFKPQINPVSEIIATSRAEAGLALLFALSCKRGQPAWFELFQQASTSSGRVEASQIQALRAVTIVTCLQAAQGLWRTRAPLSICEDSSGLRRRVAVRVQLQDGQVPESADAIVIYRYPGLRNRREEATARSTQLEALFTH